MRQGPIARPAGAARQAASCPAPADADRVPRARRGVHRAAGVSGMLFALLVPIAGHSAPSCNSTWPHVLNVHSKDGQIDHKGQAWGVDANGANEGLFGARAGKVNDQGDCFDTGDSLLAGCVGDGPAVSLGQPTFPAIGSNNPPAVTITSDATYSTDRELDSLTVTAGATLTLDGPIEINVANTVTVEDGATLRVIGIAAGTTATVYAQKAFAANAGNVDVQSDGTLEIKAGDFAADNGSDINCGPVVNSATPGKRTCGDTDGGVFVHSGSGINLDNSIGRGVFYGDGNEGRLQNQQGAGYQTLVQGAWTSGQVNTQPGTDVVAGDIPNQTLCTSGGFHYAVVDPGSGLTCDPLGITIEAHRDQTTHELVPPSDTTTIDVTARVVSGGGNVNPRWSNGSSTISYNFDGSETSTTLALSVDKNSTINIDVQEDRGTASELSPDEDPDIVFTGSGLQFSPTIGSQIAGKPSNQAPGSQSLRLEALECKNNGTQTGVFNGSEEVEWAVECVNPSNGTSASICPNKAVVLDTEPVDPGFAGNVTVPANAAGQVSTYTSHTEDFDGGVVDFALRYADAGRIRLHARACTDKSKSVANCQSQKLITGTSNVFTVRPFGFRLDFDPDGDGTFDDRAAAGCGSQASCAADATGSVFATAGSNFPVQLAAVAWQSADDTDADGVPDSNQALSDNASTPSFGHESAPETADLAQVLAAPAGGSSGTLSGGQGIGGFAAGSATVSGVSWDEVGIIDLNAALSDNDYLGAGDVTGTAPNLGRFIPDRLTIADNDPAFRDGTGMWGSPFTYMGQAFTFDALATPQLDITAVNAAGATTRNYGGEGTTADFWKLGTPGRSYTDATSGVSAAFAVDTSAGTVSWLDGGGADTRADYDGTGTLRISGDRFRYDRVGPGAKQVPFDALVDLQLAQAGLTDSDGVCFDPDTDGTCDPFTVDGDSGTAGRQPIGGPADGTELRYGRLVIDNAAGAEVAPLHLPVRAEFWNSGTWQTNAADTSTALALTELQLSNAAATVQPGPSDIVVDTDSFSEDGDDAHDPGETKIDTANTPVPVRLGQDAGSVTNAAGTVSIVMLPPGAGNTGWAELEALLSAAGKPYLQYDWDDDGVLDDNPVGRATFGVYGGNRHWIHLRRLPGN